MAGEQGQLCLALESPWGVVRGNSDSVASYRLVFLGLPQNRAAHGLQKWPDLVSVHLKVREAGR